MLTIEQKKQIQKFMSARRRELRAPAKRVFPKFNPSNMTTADYIAAYAVLNANLQLKGWAYAPAVNRTPPGLDPAYPEVVEEPNT